MASAVARRLLALQTIPAGGERFSDVTLMFTATFNSMVEPCYLAPGFGFEARGDTMRWITAALLMLFSPGCLGSAPVGPVDNIPSSDLRVLFVGNSLTYTHDVPGLVQALADRAGKSMSHGTIARPNYSLEDHWNNRITREFARLRPDVVVMQQGPSSLPESRTHLVTWAPTLADAVRRSGGEPVFYMVWPEAARWSALDAVRESYAAAAAESNARFVPAGIAWRELWTRDNAVQLYDRDGFHPSYVGALTAAHTIYAVLFDADPLQTPALSDNVSSAALVRIREAVRASLEAFGDIGAFSAAR